MTTVFLDYGTFNSGLDVNPIRQKTEKLTIHEFTQPAEVISRAQHAEIIITNKVVLDAETLAKLPKLKLICVAATGTNNIDLAAAKQRQIEVCHAKDYAGPPIAQYVFAQLFKRFQNIEQHNANVASGKWSTSQAFCLHDQPINELAGKTFGILGYGHIGQAVAKAARAFDMKVLIAERPDSHTVREDRVSFNDMLANADVVSLHCPSTPATQGLINSARLAQMKPSSILINTARGDLIDNNALANALRTQQLSYAILDVLDQEPPPSSHPLVAGFVSGDIPNLAITGHIAWASQQAQQRILNIVAANIAGFNTGKLINKVN
ncbi:D-2-hydroxyacid dehydrogenase [Thalassotalea euphylliae]|uniref:D-2-hydroxyacid dehydrogenase n=2 Tax=Thalassotalea euphylliae TaxID=1655234 RepID=A0A3E0UK93_9GAMM|nr:D-2-hydroxyacid dehydrogenase [Thalassotalea euphylliae]